MTTSSEFPYRIAFGILWLAYFIVRIVFQKRVQTAGKKEYSHVNEKQEKLFFRLFALGYLLLVFYFMTPPWIDFAGFALPVWLRWLGGVITIAGIMLFGWAHKALGENWTQILALAQDHGLVENGPYRYIRHPMYSAFFVIGIGFLLLSANWLAGVFYLLPLVLMYVTRVSKEEQMMLERFGDGYREYMQRTGRLLPKLFLAVVKMEK